MKPSLVLALVARAACLVSTAQAQNAASIASPEIHPDRRVTFRVAAPQAETATFKGDWHAEPLPMEKSPESGVWSLTVGPLAPATYIYSFTIDGVAMADPVNPRIKLRARTSGSLVEVPGEKPGLAEPRSAPAGAVEINWHRATALGGETRQVLVYTPPGYAKERNRRYPVLYLFHGNNDRPEGWLHVGNLNFIADNLIAEKRAAPLLIVMPFGHALPFGERGTPARTNTIAFEEYLFADVIPLIESKYRVARGRKNQAVAGMSMGAEQALHIFFRHRDRFAAVGAFSPMGFRAIEAEHAPLLAEPAKTNRDIDLLWIACGRQDPRHFEGSQKLVDVLAAHGIRHTWRPSDGAHNYALWREHLIEFLPLLFRESK